MIIASIARALLSVSVSLTIAQPGDVTDPDPTTILREANEAVKKAGWIEFDYEYLGTYGALGRVAGHAVVTPAVGFGELDFYGEVDLTLAPPSLTHYPKRTVLALVGERAYRIDAAGSRADVVSRANAMSILRPMGTILPPQLMRREPFGVEIDQPVLRRWAGRAVVDATPCDVVYLRFSEESGLGEQYFYFGVEDRMMRRLVFHSAGAGSGAPFNFELTLTNVRTGRGTPPRPIAPLTPFPSNWTVVDRDASPASVGREAPEWALSTPDGGTVSSRDLEGQVVVLDFWASWCPFCRRNLPWLDRMTKDLRARDVPVRVLAIQMWDESDPLAYLESQGVELDVLVGGDTLAERFLIGGTPTAIVIGKDGSILHRETGTGEDRDRRLRSVVEEALASP